jgi:hypothetical protein
MVLIGLEMAVNVENLEDMEDIMEDIEDSMGNIRD